jgi:hypothetical protein
MITGSEKGRQRLDEGAPQAAQVEGLLDRQVVAAAKSRRRPSGRRRPRGPGTTPATNSCSIEVPAETA